MHPLTQQKRGGAAGVGRGGPRFTPPPCPLRDTVPTRPSGSPRASTRSVRRRRGGGLKSGSRRPLAVQGRRRRDEAPRDVRAPQSERRSPRKARVSWLASNPGAVRIFPWPTAAESRGRKDETVKKQSGSRGAPLTPQGPDGGQRG